MEISESDNIPKTESLNYFCNDAEHFMCGERKIEPEISLHCNQNGGYLGSVSPAGELAGVKLTEMTESLETRFNRHPEFSINGNTSLDDEFLHMMANDHELDLLIAKEIDRSLNPYIIYSQIIIKLCILESQDIQMLITDYKPSEFWDSFNPAERREFIEKTLFVQEEKEQGALESIGIEKTQKNRPARSVCFTLRKGS
jgi:hypothetical protein